MPCCRPQLELGIARRPQLKQHVLSTIVKLESRHDLRVTAIEALGQPQDGRKRLDGLPLAPPQSAVLPVPPVGCGPAMISCDQRDGFGLVGLEAPEIAVPDQVVRVLVMALVGDVNADVVEQRGVFEPLPLPIGEGVSPSGLVEERHGDPCHLAGVLRPVVAAFGELDHAAPPDVGVAVGLSDLLAVPCDVIEDQPLSQREIAQRDLVGPQPLEDGVEQYRSGRGEIGTAGIQTGNPEPLFHGQRDELLAHPMQVLRRDAPVAHRRIGRMSLLR
jgi:hypothetical protein